MLQADWNQGVDDLIKFWSEFCSFSTLAFCIDKHIVGGIMFYKYISSLPLNQVCLVGRCFLMLYTDIFKVNGYTSKRGHSDQNVFASLLKGEQLLKERIFFFPLRVAPR